MACCPPGSWPELKADPDYKAKGSVETVGDLPIYKVGNSAKCIIWNYDVFGFDGGRTRQLCDQLADQGFLVIMPDYYRGKIQDPADGIPELIEFVKKETQWPILQKDWTDKVKPFAEKNGAKSFGAIGTCWGTYPVIKLAALPEFKAGVHMHPSHPLIMGPNMLNEDEKAALEAIKDKPQLFMPAGDDNETVKKGGLSEQVLGAKAKVVEFNDMTHGWTTRGDISDSKVDAAVKKAMAEATAFFNEHL